MRYDVEMEGVSVGKWATRGMGVALFCPRCGQQWARLRGPVEGWWSKRHPCRSCGPGDEAVIAGSFISVPSLLPDGAWQEALRQNPQWLEYEFLLHLEAFEKYGRRDYSYQLLNERQLRAAGR